MKKRERRRGAGRGQGAPRWPEVTARAKDWAPTRSVAKACKQGHKFTKATIVWRVSRGRVSRACRVCLNAYHREEGRRRRKAWG